MERINLIKDTWVEVFAGVTSADFALGNYPNPLNPRAYKVTYGDAMPAVDTDEFIYHEMLKDFSVSVHFENTTAKNVYVMCIFSDIGYIVY